MIAQFSVAQPGLNKSTDLPSSLISVLATPDCGAASVPSVAASLSVYCDLAVPSVACSVIEPERVRLGGVVSEASSIHRSFVIDLPTASVATTSTVCLPGA